MLDAASCNSLHNYILKYDIAAVDMCRIIKTYETNVTFDIRFSMCLILLIRPCLVWGKRIPRQLAVNKKLRAFTID